MTKIGKRIDPYLVLLVGLIAFWWLVSGSVHTPADAMARLEGTSDPESWLAALTSPVREVRSYARDHVLEQVPSEELESVAIRAASSSDAGEQLVGLWLLENVQTPGRGGIAVRFLESPRLDFLKTALAVLAVDPVPEAHERLLDLIENPDTGVQKAALEALAALKNPDDLQVFIGFLGRANPEMREIARNAVISLPLTSHEHFRALLEAIEGSDLTTAREAIHLMAAVGGPDALDTLFLFMTEGTPALAGEAAEAIGSIGGQEAIDRALDAFTTGVSRVKRHAARALGALHATSARDELWATATDPDEDFWVRYYSMEALATCGDENLVPEVIAFLERENEDPRLMRVAIESLGGMDGQTVFDLYDSILEERKDFGLHERGGEAAKVSAVVGLGYMDSDGARERLRVIIDSAEEENIELLTKAVRSLGTIGTLEDIERLQQVRDRAVILMATADEAIEAIESRFLSSTQQER